MSIQSAPNGPHTTIAYLTTTDFNNNNNRRQTLRLVPAGAEGAARLEIGTGPKQERLLLADVIGAHVEGRQLTVFAYPPARESRCWLMGSSTTTTSSSSSSSSSSNAGASGNNKAPPRRARHLRVLTDNAEAAVAWEAAIKAELAAEYASAQEEGRSGRGRDRSKRRRLLVVVNPVSGRRKARAVFDSVVEPMLRQADIDFELMGALTDLVKGAWPVLA